MLAVKNLFDLGLIRHWALSNENAYGLTMFCLACDRLGVPRPVCVQNDMSLNNRVYEGDIAEAAHQFGVVGLPYGALSGGVLTGKYLALTLTTLTLTLTTPTLTLTLTLALTLGGLGGARARGE